MTSKFHIIAAVNGSPQTIMQETGEIEYVDLKHSLGIMQRLVQQMSQEGITIMEGETMAFYPPHALGKITAHKGPIPRTLVEPASLPPKPSAPSRRSVAPDTTRLHLVKG